MSAKQHRKGWLAAGTGLLLIVTALAVQPVGGRTSEKRIYSQILVEETAAKNPDLVFISIHTVAPKAKESTMIACNTGTPGKKDGEDEISVAMTHKPILRARPGKPGEFEALVPLAAAPGTFIGTLRLVFKQQAGIDETGYLARANAIRDVLASKIPSRPSLFRVPAPWMSRS